MRKRLTKEDKEFITYQMRGAKVLSLLILSFGAFYSFFYFFIPDFQTSIHLFLLIDIGVFLIAWMAYHFGTRKYFLDLQEDYKVIETDIVQKKESYISYESGSGSLYIPVLGNLFPKLFSIKMKSKNRYYLIIKNTRYRVEEELHSAVIEGDQVELHYTAASHFRLRIQVPSVV